jgi:hypothetical protein
MGNSGLYDAALVRTHLVNPLRQLANLQICRATENASTKTNRKRAFRPEFIERLMRALGLASSGLARESRPQLRSAYLGGAKERSFA